MYLVGGPHPNKHRAHELLDEYFDANERLVTDVEVLREILHRYTSIDRKGAVQPAFDVLNAIVDEIFPLDADDLERTREITLTTSLSARDALHLAAMRLHHVGRILTFDSDFDEAPGVSRLH